MSERAREVGRRSGGPPCARRVLNPPLAYIIMIYNRHNIFRTLRLAPAAEAGAGGSFLAGGGGGGWLRWPQRLRLRQRYEPAR